jgi:hypothetical protein
MGGMMTSEKSVSSNRVFRHTTPEVNSKILRCIEMSVAYYAEHPDLIESRIDELNGEWSIERVLETNASLFSLFGLTIGVLGRRSWLILPFVVLGFLLQHAIQGWCPPLAVFRRLGYRTAEEISRERNALYAFRGDYDSIPQVRQEQADNRAERVLNLMHG